MLIVNSYRHKFSERFEKNEVVMQFCYLFLDVLSKCNGTSIHLIQNLQRIDKQERDVLLKKSASSSSSSSAMPIEQADLTVCPLISFFHLLLFLIDSQKGGGKVPHWKL